MRFAGDVILFDDMGTTGHLTRVNGGQQVVAVGVRAPVDAGRNALNEHFLLQTAAPGIAPIA